MFHCLINQILPAIAAKCGTELRLKHSKKVNLTNYNIYTKRNDHSEQIYLQFALLRRNFN